MEVLPTKTRPKKLVLVGSDGKQYTYLLKGREDLHLDERIMQLLRVVSGLLRTERHTRAYPAVRARSYVVLPLGRRAGLIQWVGGVTPLFTLYKEWRMRAQAAAALKEGSGGGGVGAGEGGGGGGGGGAAAEEQWPPRPLQPPPRQRARQTPARRPQQAAQKPQATSSAAVAAHPRAAPLGTGPRTGTGTDRWYGEPAAASAPATGGAPTGGAAAGPTPGGRRRTSRSRRRGWWRRRRRLGPSRMTSGPTRWRSGRRTSSTRSWRPRSRP